MLQLAASKVESSGLTVSQASGLGMYAVENAATLGRNFEGSPALVIPYHDIRGKPMLDATLPFFRARYLDTGVKGFVEKKQRYSQPLNSGTHAYFPKGINWASILRDTNEPIFFTEGELKAAKACACGYSTVGLGGVYNFRAAKNGIFWLPELEEFSWAHRRTYLVYDSDYVENPNVCAAIQMLGEELQERGAFSRLVTLPDLFEGKKKTGFDDYLMECDEEKFQVLIDNSEPITIVSDLWKLNDEVAYIEHPGLIVVQSNSEKLSSAAFTGHSRWATKSVPEKVVKPNGTISYEKASAAATWLAWPLRKSSPRLTYAPGQERFTEDGEYNQWRGWGCEPKKGDIKPWVDLLKFLFEGAEAGFQDWFHDWCAYPFQNPGTKLFSAVIVHGRVTGTGKSLVGYTLGDIYGRNFTKVTNDQLKNQFNSWAENKQFILGDEISGTDKRAESDKLKAVITQEEISINIKMIPEYTVPDRINYYFTSNHPDAFYIEDEDRRYGIHEVLQRAPLPQPFYQAYDTWRNNGGAAALFYNLLHRDVSNFNPHAPAFKTAARARMVAHGRSDLGTWCAELRDSPESVLRFGKLQHTRDLFTSKDLLAIYQQGHDIAGKVTANGIGRALAAAGFTQVNGGEAVRTPDGVRDRYFIARNSDKWRTCKNNKEILKNIAMGPS